MADKKSKEVPVTRQSEKTNQDIPIVLQLPQTAIPMGVLIPISYGEDYELQEMLESYRTARAELECLEANIQAIEASLASLKREVEMSHERVISKRGAIEAYLDKHLNKENRNVPQTT